MMRYLLLFATLLYLLPGNAQSNLIEWDPYRPLKWTDFKASPDHNNLHVAATFSGVRHSYTYTTHPQMRFTFEVSAYFDTNKSWKKEDRINDYVLSHEQLHFDISELHARLLRKEFTEFVFSQQFEKEIRKIYDDNNASRRAMQRRYDDETDHSKNIEAQKQWTAHLHRELKKLAAFRK